MERAASLIMSAMVCSRRALGGIVFSTVQSFFGCIGLYQGGYTLLFLQHPEDVTLEIFDWCIQQCKS